MLEYTAARSEFLKRNLEDIKHVLNQEDLSKQDLQDMTDYLIKIAETVIIQAIVIDEAIGIDNNCQIIREKNRELIKRFN
jgi:hypothetical protein